MKISVLQENLLKGVSKTNKLILSRTHLGILQNLLLVAKEGLFTIESSNLEYSLLTPVSAKVEKEGRICIPAKILLDLVSTLAPGPVSLEVKEGVMMVKSQRSTAQIPIVPAEDFPIQNYNIEGETIEFKENILKCAVDSVLFSAATDEGRPVLTGIKIEMGEGKIRLIATDGYRLSLYEIVQKSAETNREMIIPARAMAEISRIKENEKEEGIIKAGIIDEGKVVFWIGEDAIATRIIDGEYPNYQKIIPQTQKLKATISKEPFLAAVKAAAIFARDNANIVKTVLKKEAISVSANSPQVGGNTVEIDGEIEGEDGEIAFNSRFLIDAINSFSGKEIVFEMTGSLNPGVFKDSQNPATLQIIMPVRIQS